MRIATFNINGINGRFSSLRQWLEETKPDVVCLQELKVQLKIKRLMLLKVNV